MKKNCFQTMRNNEFICVDDSSGGMFGGAFGEKLVI
jgi:hypothetical protein